MPPRFASAQDTSRPLHVIAQEGLADWLAAQPPEVATWLKGTGFGAALGEVQLLPGANGSVTGAVFGYGSASARAR